MTKVKQFKGTVSFVEASGESKSDIAYYHTTFESLLMSKQHKQTYTPPFYIQATEIKLESLLDLVVGLELVSSVQTAF